MANCNKTPYSGRDELEAQRDELEARRDELEAQRDEREAQRDAREAQRDEREAQRDEREAQRDEREAQRDEREAQRDEREAADELSLVLATSVSPVELTVVSPVELAVVSPVELTITREEIPDYVSLCELMNLAVEAEANEHENEEALATSPELDTDNAVLVHETEQQEPETSDTIDTILVPETVILMPTAEPEQDDDDDDYDWDNHIRTSVSMGSTSSTNETNYGGHDVTLSGICGRENKIEFRHEACSRCELFCSDGYDGCQCEYYYYGRCDYYDPDDIHKFCLLLDPGRIYTVSFDYYFHYSSIPLELTRLFKIVKKNGSDHDDQEWIFMGLTWTDAHG